MTAMNIWRSGKAAYLLTDTAVYEPDGTLIAFTQKVVTISARDFHVAIAMTGKLFPSAMHCELSRYTFTDLPAVLSALPDVLARIERGIADPAPLGMVIASWSPDEGPRARVLANAGNGVFPAPYPAGKVCSVDYFLTGNGSHPVLARAGIVSDDIDSELLAAEIIAEQRTDRREEGYFAVGGTAYLTRVGAIGICGVKVAAWPDRIGERIAA